MQKFRNSEGIEEISELINSLSFISPLQIWEGLKSEGWFELLNVWVNTWQKYN